MQSKIKFNALAEGDIPEALLLDTVDQQIRWIESIPHLLSDITALADILNDASLGFPGAMEPDEARYVLMCATCSLSSVSEITRGEPLELICVALLKKLWPLTKGNRLVETFESGYFQMQMKQANIAYHTGRSIAMALGLDDDERLLAEPEPVLDIVRPSIATTPETAADVLEPVELTSQGWSAPQTSAEGVMLAVVDPATAVVVDEPEVEPATIWPFGLDINERDRIVARHCKARDQWITCEPFKGGVEWNLFMESIEYERKYSQNLPPDKRREICDDDDPQQRWVSSTPANATRMINRRIQAVGLKYYKGKFVEQRDGNWTSAEEQTVASWWQVNGQ